MKVLRASSTLRRLVLRKKGSGKSIGFVPTMGCLHEGHLSLVRRAKRENDFVVVSIFVNPLQFNSKSDLKNYPRTQRRDAALLKKEKVDLLYLPGIQEFYREPFLSKVIVSDLTEGLCGKTRKGHFEGVATVVLKLFSQVMPSKAYFGRKDYQQLLVIRQLVKDFDLDVQIQPCPIVREKDGLAMSSRNTRLAPAQRKEAAGIYQALKDSARLIHLGEKDPRKIKQNFRKHLQSRFSRIDYIEVVDPSTLRNVTKISGRVLIAAAVFFGNVRLIDNLIVKG